MPPSGRKGKTRARRAPATEVHEPSDAETPEAIATPSRSSRKRARGTDTAAPASRNTRRKVKDTRTADREDTEGTEAPEHEHSDAETEPALPGEAEVIASLKVADRQVNATEDFANDLLEGQENVPGYGKIAGRDWVFIIRKVEINIGRPEAAERLPIDDGVGQQASGPTARTIVDIDLGPDRQVSRSHAIITYDGDETRWYIIVNGRNGLRVDNNLLKRGAKSPLRNGSVIEIANTQMAFITTSTNGEEPMFDASIIRQAQKSSEEDDEGDEDPRNHGFRQQGLPTARSQLSNSAMYGGDQASQQRRAHPHSGQTQFGVPGTPIRAPNAFIKSSPAANYARGVMMESTETIDYSAETAKDLKPPHSYAQLIGMAILSTQEQQMTLNNIYKWIMANYAFYRFNTGGWQNSIRHNLSLNKAFTKIARRTDEPGKGMKWMIEPQEFDNFVQQGMKGCRRPNPMQGTQSTHGSPQSPMHVQMGTTNGVKKDEEATPPLSSYRAAYPIPNEAFTPERGPQRQPDGGVGLGINGDGPEYDYLTRSTPRNGRNGLTAIANAAGSPPALFVSDEGRVGGGLDTPFPLRPTQRLAPPSTLRRPSDFIQFSSPAPFWKMEGLMGSTPFKPFDLSPMKTPFPNLKQEEADAKRDSVEGDVDVSAKDAPGKETPEEDGRPKGKGSPVIPSSSPPQVAATTEDVLTASPTLSRPATAVAKTLSQLAAAAEEESPTTTTSTNGFARGRDGSDETLAAGPVQQHHQESANAFNAPPSTRQTPNPAVAGAQHPPPTANASYPAYPYPSNAGNQPSSNGYRPNNDDGGDDEGIDLARGFQSIGSFHSRAHLAMSLGTPVGAGLGQAQASAYGR